MRWASACIKEVPIKLCHICNQYNCHVQSITIQPITVSNTSKLQNNRKSLQLNHNCFIFAVVELACGEYGVDKIRLMVDSMDNGERTEWLADPTKVLKLESLRQKYPIRPSSKTVDSMEATSAVNQLNILMRRGWIKSKRDATLTHLR